MSDHWPPKLWERVDVWRREDDGKNPEGYIVTFSGDDVVIQFFGDLVWEGGDWCEFSSPYDGERIRCRSRKLVRINGILHDPIILVAHPELGLPMGDTLSVDIEEFKRRWSSNEGGIGRWVLPD